MKIEFKMTTDLLKKIHADLSRSHPFAAERVGFITCGTAKLTNEDILLLGQEFHPVNDDHYINDPRVGAMIGSSAIRQALQTAYKQHVSVFHVHRHEHYGQPRFSNVDLHESARFVPDFFNVQPKRPHGVLVLSHDSMSGLCWHPNHKAPIYINSFSIITQASAFNGWIA